MLNSIVLVGYSYLPCLKAKNIQEIPSNPGSKTDRFDTCRPCDGGFNGIGDLLAPKGLLFGASRSLKRGSLTDYGKILLSTVEGYKRLVHAELLKCMGRRVR